MSTHRGVVHMSRQARLFNVCSIHREGYRCEYRHGFCEPIDPNRVVLPREYVGLQSAIDFANNCFRHDSGGERGIDGVAWRVWWVLLYDDVHHKLLRLESDFTGHQLELDIRHIATGLTRSEHVDEGGDPQDLLDPWLWMMHRLQVKLAYYSFCRGNVAKYGDAEQQFLLTWTCSI